MKLFSILILINLIFLIKAESKDGKKKKSVVDMSDAEIEKIYEEWEENDDVKLEEDEKPAYMRPPKPIDISQIKYKDPKDLKKVNHRNKVLMLIVYVSSSLSKKEAEDVTQIWQQGLYNANYEVTRYMIDDHQSIFMVQDGFFAWEIKDYLIQQKHCENVTVDNDVFQGLYSTKKEEL